MCRSSALRFSCSFLVNRLQCPQALGQSVRSSINTTRALPHTYEKQHQPIRLRVRRGLQQSQNPFRNFATNLHRSKNYREFSPSETGSLNDSCLIPRIRQSGGCCFSKVCKRAWTDIYTVLPPHGPSSKPAIVEGTADCSIMLRMPAGS